MKFPLLLAALLLAAPAWAQRGGVPVGPRGPVTTDERSIPVVNGHPIFFGSVGCDPRTEQRYVPTVQRADYIREWTRRVIEFDLDSGALTTSLSYQTWRALIALDLGQKFFDRPVYGEYLCPPGWNGGPPVPHPCYLCAAGVGYLIPYVSTSEPHRTEKLISHETTNARLGMLKRPDLFDSAYTQSVVDRVGVLVGGYQTGGEVLPTGANEDALYLGLNDADKGADLALGQAKAAQFEDVPDVVGEEFRATGALAPAVPASIDGMGDVGDMADDLKIRGPVVRRIEVKMIDLFAGGHLTDERLRDQPMHDAGVSDLVAVAAERGVHVPTALRVCVDTKQPPAMGLSPAVAQDDYAVFGADAAKAGNGVRPLRADDGTPLFGGKFFWGKVLGSHREPPTRVPVVRLGVGGATPHRAVFIVSNTQPIGNATDRAAALCGGWRDR